MKYAGKRGMRLCAHSFSIDLLIKYNVRFIWADYIHRIIQSVVYITRAHDQSRVLDQVHQSIREKLEYSASFLSDTDSSIDMFSISGSNIIIFQNLSRYITSEKNLYHSKLCVYMCMCNETLGSPMLRSIKFYIYCFQVSYVLLLATCFIYPCIFLLY